MLYAKSKAKAQAQDAHEAIRPIDVNITPEIAKRYLPAEAAKLYDLIWRRFVACQTKAAEYAQRQVTIIGGPYTFKATGSTLMFDGFLKVYGGEEKEKEEEEESRSIPKGLKEKDSLEVKTITPKQHFTQPPPRYTEATLIKEMEKEGIGRPSTYQPILRTIQARAYTTLDEKKRFVPSELGVVVTKMLSDNLPKIMDLHFTANMEENLDKIAQGTLSRDKLLKDFYSEFEKDLTTFRGEAKKVTEPTNILCPECKQGHLIIRFGKAGPFAGCDRYPKCSFTSNFERLPDGTIKLIAIEAPKVLDEECPLCTKPLRQMQGRFGPFTACTGYPSCKYIKPVKAGFKCTQCGKGDVVQKMWKGKKFWGCSRYPDCKFSISGEIEETPCAKCNNPYLLKRVDKEGRITLTCGNKSCTYVKTIEPTPEGEH